MTILSPNPAPTLTQKLKRPLALPLAALLGVLPALVLLAVAPRAALAGGQVTNCSDDSQLTALLAGGGALTFNCGGPATIVFSGEKVISQPTRLDGGGLVTLSGADATRLFSVTAGASLSLANITLVRGQVISDGGGAIYNNGSLSLLNTTIMSSTAFAADPSGPPPIGAGGGVYNASAATLIVTSSTFLNNASFAYNGGAGIYSQGLLTITGSLFQGNQANGGDGGGLQTAAGVALVQDSTFLSNTAGAGGGIDNDGAQSLTLIHSRLAYNEGTEDGGAIDIDSGGVGGVQTYISDTFAYNRAPQGNGGAIWSGSDLTLTASVLYGNSAGLFTDTQSFRGGGIFHGSDRLNIVNTTLYDNRGDDGGGIYAQAPITLTNVTLLSNTAVLTTGASTLFVYGSGATYLRNTLLAGAAPNCVFDSGGTLSSLGHNLENADSCGLNVIGDLTGTAPHLGPLGWNGGPALTLPLLPGGLAIDHGFNTGCPSTDQRGGHRPVNATCDIGAYEFGAVVARLFLPLVQR